ncbi:MAG: GntR family transcriptional regulator [Pigmentiphaga sp.]|nr:GntR family transcriptional regulator [Pigmentiphaga sp.]
MASRDVAEHAACGSDRSGPNFERIASGRPFEEVARQIRRELQAGTLKTGDRLPPERALSAQFGISRNTLRQALRAMQTTGLLEMRPGKGGGTFIREGGGDAILVGLSDLTRMGIIQPEHLREARTALSTTVAAFAAQRRTASDLEALAATIAQSEQAARANDLDERERLGFEFQRLLAAATGNPVFIVFTNAIIELNAALARRFGAPSNRTVLPRRRRIYEAIKAGDPARAAAAMEEFLAMLERFYVRGRAKTAQKAVASNARQS